MMEEERFVRVENVDDLAEREARDEVEIESSPTKSLADRAPSLEKHVSSRSKEEQQQQQQQQQQATTRAKKSPAAQSWTSNAAEPSTEVTRKVRTPSSSSSTLLVVKGESTKSIREEELPPPNTTKALLAKFKSLERENSLQRLNALEKDKQPRATRSSNMTLSTSSLSGSFDRHSHSSGKQMVSRHQTQPGAEPVHPPATRSPSESVCSSDWDTESYGSDILQQHLLQSTQHLSSKDGGDEKEESILLTKSLLAQWKMLEEHERRLKQLEKSDKGWTASDAKIRSRSLGRLQSSMEKRISLLETPDGQIPFDADVLNASSCLSKSLTLPKTSRPSQMRNESPASLKDQMFLPSCTMSDSAESLQQIRVKDVQQHLPPPFVTKYVLAKFKEMESKSQSGPGLSAEGTKKAYKWEVKETNPVGSYRGSAVEFRYRKPGGGYEPFYRRSYSEEPRRIHFEMRAQQEAISEEGQQTAGGTPKKEKSPKRKVLSDVGEAAGKVEKVEKAEKVDSTPGCKVGEGAKKGSDCSSEDAKRLALERHEQVQQVQRPKKVVKSLLSFFNSLEEEKGKTSDKILPGKK